MPRRSASAPSARRAKPATFEDWSAQEAAARQAAETADAGPRPLTISRPSDASAEDAGGEGTVLETKVLLKAIEGILRDAFPETGPRGTSVVQPEPASTLVTPTGAEPPPELLHWTVPFGISAAADERGAVALVARLSNLAARLMGRRPPLHSRETVSDGREIIVASGGRTPSDPSG